MTILTFAITVIANVSLSRPFLPLSHFALLNSHQNLRESFKSEIVQNKVGYDFAGNSIIAETVSAIPSLIPLSSRIYPSGNAPDSYLSFL